MIKINGERLLDDLRTLRSFGAHGNGVIRTTLTDVDIASREWLAGRMRDAGLKVHIDGVSNVFGCSPATGPALIIGSHSDTQPRGGWLDGALGVMYGLEIARAAREQAGTREFAIDAVSLADEESTFVSCLGSRSWCGVLDETLFEQARNADGLLLTDALAKSGYGDHPRTVLDRDRYIGYLEAHIEQGPYLEELGLKIGVVTTIVGIRACRVQFSGEQNHAGTTPMARRKDAGVALFEFATRLRTLFQKLATEKTVWTIGSVELLPGAASIIPGEAQLNLQFRDEDEQRLEAMMAAVHDLATTLAAELGVTIDVDSGREPIAPTRMDAGFQTHLGEAARAAVGDAWQNMPSAAGHDPMVISHHLPCAMLFIPSIRGISHDFAEDSHEEDIVTGCQVLADGAARILSAVDG